MSKKVIITTTITAINADGHFMPSSPVYKIINDGSLDVVINNTLRLFGNDTHEVDVSKICARFLQMGVPVENSTELFITFKEPQGGVVIKINSAKIIQTFIKIVNT